MQIKEFTNPRFPKIIKNLDEIEDFKVFIIEMALEIKKELIQQWFSKGRNNDNILKELDLEKSLEKFSIQVEQFILRGVDTKNKFDIIELNENEPLECFFPNNELKSPKKVKELGDLHQAILSLGLPLHYRDINPSYVLMSDPKSFEWRNKHYTIGVTLNERIKETKKIKDWININYNAESSRGKNRHCVCIANLNYIKIIEEKNPVNIVHSPYNDNLIIYWCGVFKVKDPKAIEQIEISYD